MLKKAFGTYEIAKFCQVTPPTVGRWIKEGKLPSFLTGGGHQRVWAADLVKFLAAHNIPLPFELRTPEPLKVLVVDDEANVRAVMVRVLKKIDPPMEIEEASDGFEAGRKFTQMIPNLVLLDLKLPGVDGLKVCRQIRRDDPLRQVKILVVSAYADDMTRRQAISAGADDFLAKPFDVSDLVSICRKLLALNGAENGGKP